jgi:plasmid stabilization system protein ParE
MKVRLLPEARDDLRQAVQLYNSRRPGLGSELAEEVRSAMERIKAFPEAWQLLDENTRRCRTQRFPYGLIYQWRQNEIIILAVAHLHQEPGSWRDRT